MPLHRIAKVAAALVLTAAAAAAAPSGQEVVLGDVTFHQDGSVTVIHASDGAVIHYDSFDIFAHETVHFIQPGEQARVLNRVLDDAIDIDGTLLANGIVYIVSPVGVFIGGEAVVDVGGLVAAAGNISNEDFLAGVDRFELTGAVENASPDLRADAVSLLGTRVENLGEIRAPEGTIALVAGDRVVIAKLDGRVHVEVDGGPAAEGETGVRQAGLVDAGGGQVILAAGDHYSLAINHEGVTRGADVQLRGGDAGVVLVKGEIDAAGAERGGAITVTGDRVALLGARLDASGGSGGGSIRVGGDVRGEGELPTARRVYVDEQSDLVADAIGSGDGGSVVVWGDEAAVMNGGISARGGAAGGDGGFAEISSLGWLDADADVDLGADAGEVGTLLFDPQDIVIMGGTADGSDETDPSENVLNDGTLGQVLFGATTDLPEPFLIFESEIEETDANLRLEARNSITVSGTFDHLADSEGEGVVVVMPDRSLSMETRNNLDDELGSTATPGVDLGTLTWRTQGGQFSVVTGGDGVTADIAVGDVSTGGGSVSLNASNGSVSAGDIDTSGAAAGGSVGILASSIGGSADMSVGDVSTAGGSVSLNASNGSISAGDIDTSGTGTTAGGTVGVVAGSTGNSGAVAVGDVTTAGGGVQLTATAGSISAGDIDASGADGTGDANGTTGGGVGVRIFVSGSAAVGDIDASGGDAQAGGTGRGGSGGSVRITTDDGDITAGAIDASGGDNGVASGTGGESGAVALDAGIDTLASGSITLTGALRVVDGAGTPIQDTFNVSVQAKDAIEFVGVVGPHITTTEGLILGGDTVGAVTPIEVVADGTLDQTLTVGAFDSAEVHVTTPGFNQIGVEPKENGADIEVTQVAEKAGGNGVTIEIVGSPGANTIQRIDTTQVDTAADTVGTAVNVIYSLFDFLEGDDDVALQAVVASGAVTAAGAIQIESEDDVVLEDGAIAMHELLDPDAPMADPAGTGDAGSLVIQADLPTTVGLLPNGQEGFLPDGTGAILAGGSGTAIDMDPDAADTTGSLLLIAGSGIGAAGAPIVLENVDELRAGTRESGGVHVHNAAGGDLTLLPMPVSPNDGRFEPFAIGDAIAVANTGSGDIEVINDAGDLVVRGNVRAAGDGTTGGGSVTLGVTDPNTIRFLTLGSSLVAPAVDAADGITLDGDVELATNTVIGTRGDVTITGAVDADSIIQVPRDLTIVADGVVRFGDDVGSQRALRRFEVMGATELTQDTSFTSVLGTFFDTVDAASDDAAALSVVAGSAFFFGNLGETGRLRGVAVDSDAIGFFGDGDQMVVAGADGIALNPAGVAATPPTANLAKSEGDLHLETTGTLVLGPNTKLTVDGTATLVGSTVIVGDVSAQAIDVQSADFQVRARESAAFLVPGVGLVPDQGPDLIADTIATTSAPVAVGAGNGPTFATVSGVVDGAGAGSAEVVRLERPVESADLVDLSNPESPIFFDLGIPTPDPGHETPEEAPPVVELEDARPGDETAGGPAQPPDAGAVLAFLRCTQEQAEASARGCAGTPGSALDSERGDEIAQRHARLFGGSAEAQAARRLLAGADGPEREAVLRDLVALLAQIRLLGIDAGEYQRVRDRILDDALAGGSREALLADLRTRSRGIPL